MTASGIPDSISTADLQAFAALAHSCECDDESKDLSPEQITRIAQAALAEVAKQVDDPIVFKVIMLEIIDNLLSWHSHVGKELMDDGDIMPGICWLRDAGKLQAIANILNTISIGRDDWTMLDDND